MSKLVFLDDFPGNLGGSELVNETVANYLGVEITACKDFAGVEEDTVYIISNISTLPQDKVDDLAKNAKYIILEHDYKFVAHRHPWRYPNSIVPDSEKINEDLYKNAMKVFVQTEDHLSVFKDNQIKGDFESLDCSIWSEDEVELLKTLERQSKKKSPKFCVIQSENFIKNQEGCEKFCQNTKLDYDIIPAALPREFLTNLSRYSALVFFPVARETCCRLLVEARCLGLNTLTSDNSGAFKSSWYSKRGQELISFLEEKSKINLQKIQSLVK
jgi:hypothetical protein